MLLFDIVFAQSGVVNQWLQAAGIAPVQWLDSNASIGVLVLLYVWKNCGYNIVLFLAALNAIPGEYYEALRLETNSLMRRHRHITLPLIMPYTFFILVISIVNSFKSFRESYILFGPHPHEGIYMIQHFINNNFNNINYVRLSVAAILVFLVLFVVILAMFWARNRAGSVEL